MMWVLLIVLKIILYIFLALLLLFLSLLVIPFTYKGEAAVIDGISYSYRIGWFWNLFNVKGTREGEIDKTEVYLVNKRLFTVSTKKKDDAEAEDDEKEDDAKEAAESDNSWKSMFEVKFIKEAFEFIKKIIRQIKPKHLHIKGVYGFEDPSLTGMTAGFIYTLRAIVPQGRIQLEPCFAGEVLELEAGADGKVVAGKILYDTARFLLKRDIRKKLFKKSKKVKQRRKH